MYEDFPALPSRCQLRVLALICKQPQFSYRDLARELGMPVGSVADAICVLNKKGYIRTVNKKRHRQATGAGQALVDCVFRIMRDSRVDAPAAAPD